VATGTQLKTRKKKPLQRRAFCAMIATYKILLSVMPARSINNRRPGFTDDDDRKEGMLASLGSFCPGFGNIVTNRNKISTLLTSYEAWPFSRLHIVHERFAVALTPVQLF